MSEKIVGYVLLGIGIVLILLSLFNIYQVFTGGAKPVQVFQFGGISLDIASALTGSLPAELTRGAKLQAQPMEVIPAEMLNGVANLSAHVFFMSFIAGVGQRLATIGAQLLRPIKVALKEEKS